MSSQTTRGNIRRPVTRRSFLQSSLAMSALGALGTVPVSAATGPIVLRFGAIQAPATAVVRAMEVFKAELGKLSGGQFKVEVYPSGQLGSFREMMEAVQLGTQQMQVATPAVAAPFAKKMDVMTLLFLASSREKVFAAVDGEFGKRLNATMEEVGFRIVGWWDTGPRHFLNNRRPINTPDDLKGLKLRVIPSPAWVKFITVLGANPVAMDYKELFSGLQQNVIDGYEGIVTDVDKSSMYQVVKYLSLSYHLFDVFGVYINKKLYESFTQEQQKMLGEAMRIATAWQRKAQLEEIEESLKKLRSLMQVNEISEANRKLFAEKVRPAYKDFEKDLGKDLIDAAVKAMA
ncbi:MAG TPA: TRAP transporter substrate-binding protein [Candidatus Methylomirabilis sp.]|nr:TRAP transporter substrate-binding protein [Candidatus Methylomirabilis sp.]